MPCLDFWRRRDWRHPTDPFRDLFIAAGVRLPLVFDLYLNLRYTHPKNGAVLVYTFGCAGTRSLQQSLVDIGVEPVFAVHYLHPERARRIPHYPKNLGLVLHAAYVRKSRPLKIVSTIRNPIDHAVSVFFRDRFMGLPEIPDVDVPELTQTFTDYVQERSPDEDWFTEELKPALGIDVYDTPFDPEKGYSILRLGAIELLLLRLEADNSEREKIVGSFLGVSDFRWRRDLNSAQNRRYSQLYRAFQSDAKLSCDLVTRLTHARYAQHFYSPGEIADQRSRWS